MKHGLYQSNCDREQENKIKLIFFILMFTFIMLFSACQEKKNEREFEVYSFSLENSGEQLVAAFFCNKLYYAGGEQNKNKVYMFNTELESTESIYELQGEKGNIVLMSVSSNDQIALLTCEKKQNEDPNIKFEILLIDSYGNLYNKFEITNFFMNEPNLVSPKSMLLDFQGNIYVLINNEIIVFNNLGKLQCHIVSEENIKTLFLGDDGQIFCVYTKFISDKMKMILSELDLSESTLLERKEYDFKSEENLVIAGNQDKLLISENNFLYYMILENGEKEEILNWIGEDIDQVDIHQIGIFDNQNIAAIVRCRNIDCTNSFYKLLVLENSTEENSNDEGNEQKKEILTYATMYLDAEMRTWIVEYNQTHESCRIEVKEYGRDDYETGLMRLNADIVSGNAPDIIDLTDIDIGTYISKEVLLDLSPLLKNDTDMDKENFIPNILQLYEEGGKIYGVAIGFRLETLMGKKTILNDRSQWTFDKMKKMIEEMPQESNIIDNLSSIGLLRISLQMGMDEYVDWGEGTCSFESNDFIQLLELANSMNGKVVDGDIEENLSIGRLLLNRVYISSIEDYKEAIDMFHGEEVVCVGYPSPKGGTSLVYPHLPIGISSMCENQEEAWEFVSSLLGEEFQEKHIHFNFPIRISSLEKEFELAMFPQNTFGNESIDLPSQKEVDTLYEIINTSYGNCFFDSDIWKIIEEESTYFFTGVRSVEETVQVIQNRVEVYISENY